MAARTSATAKPATGKTVRRTRPVASSQSIGTAAGNGAPGFRDGAGDDDDDRTGAAPDAPPDASATPAPSFDPPRKANHATAQTPTAKIIPAPQTKPRFIAAAGFLVHAFGLARPPPGEGLVIAFFFIQEPP